MLAKAAAAAAEAAAEQNQQQQPPAAMMTALMQATGQGRGGGSTALEYGDLIALMARYGSVRLLAVGRFTPAERMAHDLNFQSTATLCVGVTDLPPAQNGAAALVIRHRWSRA